MTIDYDQSQVCINSQRNQIFFLSITFCPKYIWEGFPGVMEILNNNRNRDVNGFGIIIAGMTFSSNTG